MSSGISSGPNLSCVVTECGTQTLANKTLTDPKIGSSSITFDQICTPVANPTCCDIKFYAKACGSLFTLDSNGIEIQIGAGGGGGLDVFYKEDFEATVDKDCFTTGNNATFDNGGCFAGC